MNTKTATVQPLGLSLQLEPAISTNHALVTVDKPLAPAIRKDIADAYTHFDIALRSVDTVLGQETKKVGLNRDRDGANGFKIGAGVVALTAGVTAAAIFEIPGWWFAATVATAIPGWIGGYQLSERLRSAFERTPVSQPAVAQLRVITDGVPGNSAEAVAISARAGAWIEDFKKREIHGPGAHAALQKLALVGAGADAESSEQSVRWTTVRYAAETLSTGSLTYRYDKDSFAKAFEALPDDERRAIAPILIDAIFIGERPRAKLGFELASSVYALLRRTADNETVRALTYDATTAPGEASELDDAHVTARAEHLDAEEAKNLPAESFACNVAGLQTLLASFETLLTDVLADRQRFMRGTGAVDQAKIGRVLAMANAPERTTVEKAFLAKRLERFGNELNDAQLYGYDARVEISRFVQSAVSVPNSILKSAKTLEAYFAATAPDGKATLTEVEVSAILDALRALAPEQQQSAALRAQARYFDGEKARGKTEFAAATRLGTGLLKFL